ncbi:MAG TPA: hypothetical protein VE990_01885 [Acidimicrobiales bacterium]|nr:hypothetical protein [Acidimicrobiales bacterium]
MGLAWRDGVATLLVAAIVVPYIGYLSWGSVPFIQDPTGMSAVGLILGAVAAYVGGWIALQVGDAMRYLTGGLGLLALVLGVLGLVGENLFAGNWVTWEGVLAGFMASIVALWGIAIGRHAGFLGGGETQTPAGTRSA